MTETKDGLPVHDLAEIDVPLPEPGALHLGAMREAWGEAGLREVRLASRVALLEETVALLQAQVAQLKEQRAACTCTPKAPATAPAEDLVGANGRAG